MPLEILVKDPPVGAVTTITLVTVSTGGSVMVIVAPEDNAKNGQLTPCQNRHIKTSLQMLVGGPIVVVTVVGGTELLALAEYAGGPPTLMAAM